MEKVPYVKCLKCGCMFLDIRRDGVCPELECQTPGALLMFYPGG